MHYEHTNIHKDKITRIDIYITEGGRGAGRRNDILCNGHMKL